MTAHYTLAVALALASSASAATPDSAFKAGQFCLATRHHPPEGVPRYWDRIDCTDGVKRYSEDRWCMTFSPSKLAACQEAQSSETRRLMAGIGYAETAGSGWIRVFQKNGTPRKSGEDVCVVERTATGPAWRKLINIEYRVSCGDDDEAVTVLNTTSKDKNSLEAIVQHMGKSGHVLAGEFDPYSSFRLLLFVRP